MDASTSSLDLAVSSPALARLRKLSVEGGGNRRFSITLDKGLVPESHTQRNSMVTPTASAIIKAIETSGDNNSTAKTNLKALLPPTPLLQLHSPEINHPDTGAPQWGRSGSLDALSEEELQVSASTCWCFARPTPDNTIVGAVDLVAIREAEISEKSREAERMEQTALREAEELAMMAQRESDFQSSFEGMKAHEVVLEEYRVAEPNYIGFGVYLSSFLGAKNLDIMQDLNIGYVLVAASKLPQRFKGDVEYLQLEVADWPGEDILSHFSDACYFMREAVEQNRNVLVHCSAGVSRSASCVIAYLMKEHHLNFYHARKLVRTNRGCIKPNRGFIRQLLLWDRFHYEIRADPEVYFMWKMEIYSKEEKMAPFSTVQCGLDPLELFKPKFVDRFFKEYSSQVGADYLEDLHIFCCRKCARWLFTRLNIEPENETEKYYSIDRMNWAVTINVHGRISCPNCGWVLGSYSMHKQILDGENVSKFVVDKSRLSIASLPLSKLVEEVSQPGVAGSTKFVSVSAAKPRVIKRLSSRLAASAENSPA